MTVHDFPAPGWFMSSRETWHYYERTDTRLAWNEWRSLCRRASITYATARRTRATPGAAGKLCRKCARLKEGL